MNYTNEGHRLLHLSRTGPRALARAAGVSTSTAAAWHAGQKRPGTPETKIAIELELHIPREAWTMRPGFFKSEGQLRLWLVLHPICRVHDHDAAPCPVCDAPEAAPASGTGGEQAAPPTGTAS